MATTQETYRLGTRYPRYTTKLNAFNAGMYLTNQVEPEGYVKRMVNYDIDATGSHIKPRKGRQIVQDLNLETSTFFFNEPMILSYIYCYAGTQEDSETGTPTRKLTEPKRVLNTSDILLRSSENGIVYTAEGFKPIDKDGLDYNNYIAKSIGGGNLAFDKPIYPGTIKYLVTTLNNEMYSIQENTLEQEDEEVAPGIISRVGVKSLMKTELGYYRDYVLDELDRYHPEDKYFFVKNGISARTLNPLEAATTGFNMLSKEPYTFEDSNTGSLSILGIMKYKANDDVMSIPILSPNIGETVKLRVYYQYSNADISLKYKVEVRNLNAVNSDFETIIASDTTTAGEPWYINITPKYEYTQIRITVTEGDDTTTTTSFVDSIICNNDALKAYEPKKINILRCKGMISWYGYLGLYGVSEAPDTIFFSDIEDPSYFPFPNNVITFDNDILAVHNYLDYLLVITVDSIYLVSIGTNIMTSTVKRVMSNIYIPEIDARNLIVLKDQIFFKDATQFYVLKPNNYTSDATDLKNYVISTAIDNYTKNFTSETVKLLNEVYKTTNQKLTKQYQQDIKIEDFEVETLYSYLMDEDVHYIYRIQPYYTDGKDALNIGPFKVGCASIDIHLIYNTLTRAWRIYLKPAETGTILPPNVRGLGYIAAGAYLYPLIWKNKTTGEYYEFFSINGDPGNVIENLNYSYDTLRVTALTDTCSDDNFSIDFAGTPIQLSDHYNNYNYIDTGIIAIEDIFTKRWREVQFNILNAEPTMIPFYSSFILDGVERVHSTHYQLQHITDPDDPEYGKIYITPSEMDNLEVGNVLLHGTSTLAGEATDTDYWALDLSQFPELTMVTVRFNLQGRGRHASLKLLNTSLKRYELADINWVYRMMSAR